ncbi:hypothetical protein Bhyg_08004 [Pseudolycoriella hygida]|uniref:Uncharacterized protein n=1 Tax=Pseudolycoriella hygida TaxID=35572 RepID=A0A9Q0S3X1_9DIPT|nr:hypothetical protein Bhyg_08004 [Pseudolycoriella hygida]
MNLVLDGNKLLGNNTSKLAEIAPKIILYASRKKRICSEAKSILLEYKELSTNYDNTDALQQLTAIKILPYLTPIGKGKLNKTTLAQLFCPYFKTEYDADKYNLEFKEDYKESSLVLKPRLYFFGDSSSPNT